MQDGRSTLHGRSVRLGGGLGLAVSPAGSTASSLLAEAEADAATYRPERHGERRPEVPAASLRA